MVKPQEKAGGTACHIDYAAKGDAEAELRAIAGELATKFSVKDTLLIRRTGRLGLDEIISLIAVSSSVSENALEACKLGIRRMKKMKTIVKSEVCG